MPAPLVPTPLAGVCVIFTTDDRRYGYIGQSADMTVRWLNELNQLLAGCHHNKTLQAAFTAAPSAGAV